MSDSRMVNSPSLTTSRAATAAAVSDDTISVNDDAVVATVLMTACHDEDSDAVKDLLSSDQVSSTSQILLNSFSRCT